jgi:prevent-host-death family protein
MREVGILEAKTHLSALVDAVEREGEEVLITRHGRVVARLSAVAPEQTVRRQVSGEELLARFRSLRERISANRPELDDARWEDLKDEMRR